MHASLERSFIPLQAMHGLQGLTQLHCRDHFLLSKPFSFSALVQTLIGEQMLVAYLSINAAYHGTGPKLTSAITATFLSTVCLCGFF